MARQQDQLRDADQRLDPESAEAVVGALVAETLLRRLVSPRMSAATFRRGVREFAGIWFDAGQLVGHLRVKNTPHGQVRLPYKPYGEPLAYRGVAELLDRSTVVELCELGERYLRETARQSEGSDVRPSVRAAIVRGYVGKAFAVRVMARSARVDAAVVGCTYRRPREFRPRRQRVSRGPRKARAPDDPDPEPERVATPLRYHARYRRDAPLGVTA